MILLTGSSGFIGTAFRRRLEGDVRCVVRRFAHGAARGSSVFTIDQLSSATRWDGAFDGVHTIVHLAAMVPRSRGTDRESQRDLWETNVAGTIHLARAAAHHGVRRFVFLSSVAVYGSTSVRPYSEMDAPAPSTVYGASKWQAESGLRAVAQASGMQCVVVRAPMVYGPDAPGTFRRLVHAARSGLPLPIRGVRNSRSFIGVENLVDVIHRCTVHSDAANETFLVADGADVSTSAFFQLLCEALGRPCRTFRVPTPLLVGAASALGRRADALSLVGSHQVSIEKVSRILGWVPPVSMAEQLRRVALSLHA